MVLRQMSIPPWCLRKFVHLLLVNDIAQRRAASMSYMQKSNDFTEVTGHVVQDIRRDGKDDNAAW